MTTHLKLFSVDCDENVFTENFISESGPAVKAFAMDKDYIYMSGYNINQTASVIAKYSRAYPHELIYSVETSYESRAACLDDLYLYLLLQGEGYSIEKRKKSDLSVVIEPVYIGAGQNGQCLCILKNKLFYIGYNYATNSSKIIMFDTDINYLNEYILPENVYTYNLISDTDHLYINSYEEGWRLSKLDSSLNIVTQSSIFTEPYIASIAAGKNYIYGVIGELSYGQKKIWVHRFSKETLEYINLFGEYNYSFDYIEGGYFGAEAVVIAED